MSCFDAGGKAGPEAVSTETALLLVDLQEDYLAAPGLSPPATALVEAAAALLAGARARGAAVCHVWTTVRREPDDRMAHWRANGDWRCEAGTRGHATPAALAPLPGELVVDKHVFTGFAGGALEAGLRARGVGTVIVAGLHLHACVRTTALDAYQRGYRVAIVDDAVASDDPLHAAVTRRYLAARGIPFLSLDEATAALGGQRARRAPSGEAPARAVAATRAAAPAWAALAVEARARVLERTAAGLEGAREGLARDIAIAVGKPIRQARGEVGRSAALLRAAIRFAVGPDERACGARSTLRRLPLGTIAAITPWNNPLGIPVGKLAPALIHGNGVVLKPSPPGDGIARELLRHLLEAGLPEGVVTIASGGGDVAARLLETPGVDGVSFTGSDAAGFAVVDACARRRLPLQAELGGNNAALVWEDADLDAAATALVEGAFAFAGQRCTANRRIVVAERVAEPLWERLVAALGAMVPGDPLDEATVIGPVIDERAARRLRALVARAAPAARRTAAPHAGEGRTVGPTLFFDPPPDHEIVVEESFGPIAVVQIAADLDHALRLVNGVRHGLAAALFSGDGRVVEAFLARAQAGILKLGQSTADADAEAPFGGWKASGIGPPEHGEAAREFFTRYQTVYRAPA